MKVYIWKDGEAVEDKRTVYRGGRRRLRTYDYHTTDSLGSVEVYVMRHHMRKTRPPRRDDAAMRIGGFPVYLTRPDSDTAHDVMRKMRVGKYENEIDPNRIETFRTDRGTHHRIKKDWEMAIEQKV